MQLWTVCPLPSLRLFASATPFSFFFCSSRRSAQPDGDATRQARCLSALGDRGSCERLTLVSSRVCLSEPAVTRRWFFLHSSPPALLQLLLGDGAESGKRSRIFFSFSQTKNLFPIVGVNVQHSQSQILSARAVVAASTTTKGLCQPGTPPNPIQLHSTWSQLRLGTWLLRSFLCRVIDGLYVTRGLSLRQRMEREKIGNILRLHFVENGCGHAHKSNAARTELQGVPFMSQRFGRDCYCQSVFFSRPKRDAGRLYFALHGHLTNPLSLAETGPQTVPVSNIPSFAFDCLRPNKSSA